MRWIVGLGNPGKRYAGTRHNVGFEVVDRFARRLGYGSFHKKFSSWIADKAIDAAGGEKVFLMKPQTYMNRSGIAVKEALGYFGGDPKEMLVVHDDLDLPLGRLRYKQDGSSGGHRGVDSVLQDLGTEEFDRLKVGIGRREGQDPAEYVLDPAGGEERAALDQALERAAESLDVWIHDGFERAAQLYNQRASEDIGDAAGKRDERR